MDELNPLGATPLDEEEKEGLLLFHITTREELNRWEQENINKAIEWCFANTGKNILSIEFIKKLHDKMFCDVWVWAGKFRKTDKNIGVSHWKIITELKQFLDDFDYCIKNKSFTNDELAGRFHHRLVSIHPFPDGNGRHARLATNIIQTQMLHEIPFTWGNTSLTEKSEARTKYITALQNADKGNYLFLIEFARS